MALSHFAREIGAGKDKRILLVLDQAGWHTPARRSRSLKAWSWSSCPLTGAAAR